MITQMILAKNFLSVSACTYLGILTLINKGNTKHSVDVLLSDMFSIYWTVCCILSFTLLMNILRLGYQIPKLNNDEAVLRFVRKFQNYYQFSFYPSIIQRKIFSLQHFWNLWQTGEENICSKEVLHIGPCFRNNQIY